MHRIAGLVIPYAGEVLAVLEQPSGGSIHIDGQAIYNAAERKNMPAEQRAAMADPKQAQWRDLLDAMQLYGDLSAPNRELIWRTNALRTKVALRAALAPVSS